jgi:NADH:ubiquinone oxidoreductase subunit 2 (subunit N)
LAIIAVIFSTVSCFYYLRLIHFIYFQDKTPFLLRALNDNVTKSSTIHVSLERSLILGISLYFILTLLIYPNPLLMLTFDSLLNSLY